MSSRSQTDTLDDLLDFVIRQKLIDVHTSMPGIIEHFDASTQTAKVNLGIKKILKNGNKIAIAPVINVPVHQPAGGGWNITFPVSKGDECLVVFSERAIDNWLQLGGQQEPADRRTHAYNDAIALVGLKSNSNALSAYSSNSLQIRNNSGTTYINVTDDSITLEINGGGAIFNADKSVIFANGAQITADGRFVSASGKDSDLHTHGGVSSGTSSTGVAQ